MKRKLLFTGAVMLFVASAVAGVTVYSKLNVPDLISSNVEALAMDEIEPQPICRDGGYGCFSSAWYPNMRELEWR